MGIAVVGALCVVAFAITSLGVTPEDRLEATYVPTRTRAPRRAATDDVPVPRPRLDADDRTSGLASAADVVPSTDGQTDTLPDGAPPAAADGPTEERENHDLPRSVATGNAPTTTATVLPAPSVPTLAAPSPVGIADAPTPPAATTSIAASSPGPSQPTRPPPAPQESPAPQPSPESTTASPGNSDHHSDHGGHHQKDGDGPPGQQKHDDDDEETDDDHGGGHDKKEDSPEPDGSGESEPGEDGPEG